MEKGDYVEPSPREGLIAGPVTRCTALLEELVNRDPPEKGDAYRHEDGTAEVVFATVGERVLTVREYPSLDRFHAGIETAGSTGINEEVAAIPSIDAFRDEDDDHGNEES